MINQLLLLIEKHTDTLIEQTKTCLQETLEFVMGKQMEKLSLNHPINLADEGKLLLSVTSSSTTISFFNITNENNSFQFQRQVIGLPEEVQKPFTNHKNY